MPGSAQTGLETDVLALIADGLTTAEIAAVLSKSSHAVARQIRGMLSSTGARNRAQLVGRAFAARMLPGDVSQSCISDELRLDEPVIVLTGARSGSTLLRFLLDAHPSLACPAETSIAEVCARMGTLSILLDGPPANGRPALNAEAGDAIRKWVSSQYAPFLLRLGKKRWCDKSLGAAETASSFLQLYPGARLICLYRHAMDAIDSILEACPFGLAGYGLDRFATAHPGNSVAAAADYWVWHTRGIMQFEATHPDCCLRVRYEDIAADPQLQADRIFTFLGEEPLSSAETAAFAMEPAHWGPSDHKIFDTAGIHVESLGRGARIPVSAVPGGIIAQMNSLLEQLGYEPVGEQWNSVPVPVLADQGARPGGHAANTCATGLDQQTAVLDELEAALLPRMKARIADHGAGQNTDLDSITITAVAPRDGTLITTRSWRVDVAARIVAPVPGPDHDGWGIIGDVRDWAAVLNGHLGPQAALRRGSLRLTPQGEPAATHLRLRHDTRAYVVTWLLAPAENQYYP